MELINTIKEYKQLNNKMPTVEYLSTKLNISINEIMLELQKLEQQGYLKLNKYESNKKLKISQKSKKKKTGKLYFDIEYLKILCIKILMFIVGIKTTIMSIYYTYIYFLYDMGKLALIWSLALVFFNILSFQLIKIYNELNKLMKFTFIVAWIVVVLFSMGTSIAGQYNLYFNKKKFVENENIQIKNSKTMYNSYIEQIKNLKIDLESKRIERDKLVLSLNSILDINSKEYESLNSLIYRKNLSVINLNDKITELINKKDKILLSDVNVTQDQKLDYFEWLSNRLYLGSEFLRFLQYVFLAMFIDIIGPLSFNVILFLNDGGKNKNA